jgi:hypothetical protein
MSKFLQKDVSALELLSRKRRSEVLHALLVALPDTPHPALANKVLSPMAGSFECINMSIHKFRYLQDHLTPVEVQRDHLRRIETDEVSYLYNVSLAHAHFVLVMAPGSEKSRKRYQLGKEYKLAEMLDGNTRSQLFFVGDRLELLPDTVAVLVYYPDSKPALRHLYHCTDSGVNSKKMRHNLTSFYRTSAALAKPERLSSAMVRDGTFLSALRRLALLHSMPSLKPADPELVEKLEAMVHLYQYELKWLDQFGLKAKGLKSQGFVALALYLRKRLGATCDADLVNFVNELIRMSRGTTAGVSSEVISAFSQLSALFPQGFSGEAPVDSVFMLGYSTFYVYLGNKALERKQAERKALQAAQKALPKAPAYFVFKLEAAREKMRFAA